MARKKEDRTYWVTAINPKTNKPSTMTKKAYDGVYAEKGFELVDRDNADEATAGRSRKAKDADDDGSDGGSTGSAADIANKIGLGGGNEKHANNKGAISEGRQPSGRDRVGS